jgi:hypothetical protein
MPLRCGDEGDDNVCVCGFTDVSCVIVLGDLETTHR